MQTLSSPNTFIYICFYFLLGRCAYKLVELRGFRFIFFPVYCNSLLATLNVRNKIRERGHNDLGISLPQLSDSGASTVDNHKVAGLVRGVAPPVYRCCSRVPSCRNSKPRLWGKSRTPKPEDTQRVSIPAIEIDVRHSFSQHQSSDPELQKPSPSLNLDDRDEHHFKVHSL